MNKRILSAISIIFLSLLIIIGCSAQRDPERYYNKKEGFSIKFPKGWETKPGIMGSLIFAISPKENPDDQFQENVNIIVEALDKEMTLEEYSRSSSELIRKMLTDYQEHDNSFDKIDNRDAKLITCSHRMGVFNLKCLIAMMVKDKKAYVVTCTATPEEYPSYQAVFQDVVRTFKYE